MNPLTLALRIGAAACLSIGMFVVVYAIGSQPSRVSSRLGLRGLKRQAALAKNEGWAMIEPLVRWLGVRVAGVLPPNVAAAIDVQIANAGDYLGMTAEEYVALSILSALLGLVAAGVVVWISGLDRIFCFGGLVLGGMIPYMQISGEATERLKNIGRGLPYVIDLMALSMSAGLDFPGAVRQVVDKSSNPNDPIVEEFTLLLQALTLGRTRKDSLLELSKRAPVDTVREFVSALVQAEERGNPVADVLAIQASVSRNRRSVRAEEAASKAGVKMTGPLMLAFFAILCLVMGPAMLNLGNSF
jgi:tight adherence protein C